MKLIYQHQFMLHIYLATCKEL